MKKTLLTFVFAAVSSSLVAGEAAIRYTGVSPFDASGGRIEAVWKKADTCVRFVEVIKADVSLDQSRAQLLFDENNLYVSLTGFFDPKFKRGDSGKSMGASNHFEFMIKPDGGSVFHVIADEFGRTYFARNKAELRDCGVMAKAVGGKDRWTLNLAIPFGLLGVRAPEKDLKARVGIFRMNVNVHERQLFKKINRVCSVSGFTPNDYNYSVVDNWAPMTFTRKEGEAARVEGPDLGRRVNLFANPDFDIPGRGWYPSKNTVYQETMAMSGEWIYRQSGKGYQMLQTGLGVMKPSTKYTMVVKARSFGSGSALRIVELVRDKTGKIREGRYVTHLTPVGNEMHEYFLPFTSSEDTPYSMVFYRVDSKAGDTGLDIASARLYEGDISSFEIRKTVRPGRMAPVAGTEVPARPSEYGRMARPFKALVIVASKYLTREPDDIFAGTGAQYDVLLAERKDQDVYSTDDDPATVLERIKKGWYDLYMVPSGGAGRIGKELAANILANVEKGAGLYLERNRNRLHFKPVVRNGPYGKGRVFLAATAGRYNGYLPCDSLSEYGKSFFPRRTFAHPRVAADAVKTAFGPAEIPGGAKTRRKSFVYGGMRHEAVWYLDGNGDTLDWRHEAVPATGARLGEFTDEGGVSTVAVEGDVSGHSLKWVFRDFSGRVLARGEEPASSKISFKVPREKLYTNFGGVMLRLVRGGETVDQRGEAIFVPGNDRARLFSDFSPSMWPGSCPLDDVPEMNRRLEEIGMRSSIIPSGGSPAFEQHLSCGISVGGNWLGTGDMFCGWPQKSNVRAQNFNTLKWRSEKKEQVRKIAAQTAKFGVFQNVLCDEPNLVRHGRSDEVDAHPENLAEYRRRMEAKYGDIAEYNRRHKTAHAAFSDLGQTLQADARAAGNPAEFIEWRNFNVDRWCEAIRLVSDGAREGDPDAPFSMCNSFGQSALSGNDYWKLFTRAGLGMSQEYTSMVYFGRGAIYNFDEFIRSFRPDLRVWGWTGYFYTAERAKFMPWWFAAHRYGGFSWYAATAPGYNLIDPKTFALTVDGRELKASLEDSRLMDGLGKAFLEYDWAERDVAIYYSHDSLLLATILGPETRNGEIAAKSPLHDYMYSRQGAQYLVEDLLCQHDFVAPEQVVGEKLSRYKLLFMPRITAMSDAEVAAVKRFVSRGGRVIADELPGGYDELGVKRAENPFKGMEGVVVTGKNFDDLDKAQRAATLKMFEEAGVRRVAVSPTSVDVFGREAMHFTDGGNELYVILRQPSRSQDQTEETFVFPRGGYLWDVRARKPLGKTRSVTTKVPHAGAAVYAALPYVAKGLSLKAPSRVEAGGTIGVDIKLDAEGAAVGTHVFNVRFVPPSGECRFHFRRNVTAKGGAARVEFPVALDDEKGGWKVAVEDALTGLRAERTVDVTGRTDPVP